jgi:hypothetical protein
MMEASWEIAVCATCMGPFARKEEESYRAMCIPCFKEMQGWTLNQSDQSLIVLQSALKKSLTTNVKLKRQAKKLVGKLPYRDLMILCHPDKHNGSKKATETFQKLVDLKIKK